MGRLDKIQQVIHPEDVCQECDYKDCTRCAIKDILIVLRTEPEVIKDVCGKRVKYQLNRGEH